MAVAWKIGDNNQREKHDSWEIRSHKPPQYLEGNHQLILAEVVCSCWSSMMDFIRWHTQEIQHFLGRTRSATGLGVFLTSPIKFQRHVSACPVWVASKLTAGTRRLQISPMPIQRNLQVMRAVSDNSLCLHIHIYHMHAIFTHLCWVCQRRDMWLKSAKNTHLTSSNWEVFCWMSSACRISRTPQSTPKCNLANRSLAGLVNCPDYIDMCALIYFPPTIGSFTEMAMTSRYNRQFRSRFPQLLGYSLSRSCVMY